MGDYPENHPNYWYGLSGISPRFHEKLHSCKNKECSSVREPYVEAVHIEGKRWVRAICSCGAEGPSYERSDLFIAAGVAARAWNKGLRNKKGGDIAVLPRDEQKGD